MKPVYKRENLEITEFDTEDVITTSGMGPSEDPSDPTEPTARFHEIENAYGTFNSFNKTPGSWF